MTKSRIINNIKICLVVPVFNEEEAVPIFLETIGNLFKNRQQIVEVFFVDDGSTDKTVEIIMSMSIPTLKVRVAALSRNFGKEAALTAGLKLADGDIIIPIDVDLQDPPEIIFSMINRWEAGYDVVLGRRANRDTDSWAKRTSAKLFYKIHNKLSDIEIPENVGDFRLLDRKVVDAINLLPESRRFMKGIFSWVGFKTTYVDYVRPSRIAGTSKFNGWKLWNFALEGITSFSTIPLRLWTYLGLVISSLSFIFLIYLLTKILINGIDIPGYASLMVGIAFLGGVQLIGIGVIGEYLGRVYIETKHRPVYIVNDIYECE